MTYNSTYFSIEKSSSLKTLSSSKLTSRKSKDIFALSIDLKSIFKRHLILRILTLYLGFFRPKITLEKI
jgi:hypothetical protein